MDDDLVVTTVSEQVYLRLKKLIMSGKLAPGSRLIQEDLAAQLGVSRSPIRDAIDQLVRDGLAKRRVGSRAYVTLLSTKELDDLFDVRVVLEPLALELAMRNAPEETLEQLRQVKYRQVEATKAENMSAVLEEAFDFHHIILTQSGNSLLQEILLGIFDRLDRYRQLVINAIDIRHDSIVAHETIIDLLLGGDVAAARAHLAEHVEAVRKTFLQSLPTPSSDEHTTTK